MYRIAICDNIEVSWIIEQFISDYARLIPARIETDIYAQGEELYQALAEGEKYDIIFLEIQTVTLDGVRLGCRIRNELKNHLVKLIYVSLRQDRIMDIFEADAQDFILKPITEAKIDHVLQRMIDKIEENTDECFSYRIGSVVYREFYRDISYFEVRHKLVYIKTKTGDDEFYGTLKSIEEQVKDHPYFFRASRNYIVNLRFVKEFYYGEITMRSGEVIPLGVSNYKKLLKSLNISLRKNKGEEG